MTEGARTRKTIEERCDGLETKVDKLLEYHEKVPPSNPGDLDLMEKVLNQFKVGMMNDILQQFKIDRPAGVKREGKAALIVKNVPRTDLLKLLEERPSPSMGAMETASASSSQPARGLQAFFGGAASSAPATAATCSATVKSGKRKGAPCGADSLRLVRPSPGPGPCRLGRPARTETHRKNRTNRSPPTREGRKHFEKI